MPTLRPFLVVLLKNFYLRKRQWCVSFCEFLLPPILTGLLLLVTTPPVSFCGIPSPSEILSTNSTGSGTARTLATTSGVFHEQCASNRFLSYTPSNSDVKTIVEEAIKNMCPSQTKLGIMSFDNEDKLENYILAKGGPGDLLGSVVFTTDFLNNVIHYKIRLPAIFYSEVDASRRYYETIVYLQLAINEALLKKLTGRASRISLVPFFEMTKSIDQERSLRQLAATRKPSPRKWSNYGPRGIMIIGIFGVTFGSMFMIPSITRNVIGEKNTGIKELLRMTGVSLCAQYMGWLIHVLLPIAVSTVLIVILLLTPMKSLFEITDEDDIPWLVGLLRSNIFLCWLILFVYGLAAAAQVFFICSILRNTTIATSVALLLWGISIVLGIIGYMRTLIPGGLKLLFSVFPNSALFFIFADIDYLECMGPGLRFRNAWQIRINRRGLFAANTGWYINILFADFIAYNALAVYLDLVLPTEHGIARPVWLFNCKRKQKLSEIRERERLIGEAECGKLDREENPSFERNPPGAVIAVRVMNLVKSFGLKVSVDNLSLRMFSGDIFALLGHNGAGKTTTISMLTGLLEPTSGTAILNGHDIRYERDKARSIMGFCPQHNMLFERLTVMQQLKLFGMIRGLSIVQADDQARNLLFRLNIFDKANVEVFKLSGGHKRMVCLGLAIIGGTRLIFLDEPTSTMDPQARRAVWDLLLELRVQRTMLLTTHSMEEADVLGDRIGIMAFGKLQCCGSASFLKKFYGSGYTLKFTLDSRKSREEETPSSTEITTRPEAENLLAVIQNHIPDASSKQLSNMEIRPNTAAFLLPAETATTMALSSMFQELDQVKQNEGHQYKAISLKVTTLDEVFLNVGNLAHEEKYGAFQEKHHEEKFQKAPKVKRAKCLVQFVALFNKKATMSFYRWGVMLLRIIVPLLVVAAGLALVHFSSPPGGYDFDATPYNYGQVTSEPVSYIGTGSGRTVSRQLSSTSDEIEEFQLDSYPEAITLFSEVPSSTASLKLLIGRSAVKVNDLRGALNQARTADPDEFKTKYFVAFQVDQKDPSSPFVNAYCNDDIPRSKPLAAQIATNILLIKGNRTVEVSAQKLRPSSPPRPINVLNNAPNDDDDFKETLRNRLPFDRLPIGLFSAIVFAAVFSTAPVVAGPIEERILQIHQLQLMTGVSPFLYWASFFIWDFFMYLVFLLFGSLMLWIWENQMGTKIVTMPGVWEATFIILLVYGPSAIIYNYLITLRSTSISGGVTLILIIHGTFGVLAALAYNIILTVIPPIHERLWDPKNLPSSVLWTIIEVLIQGIGHFTPTYSLGKGLFDIGRTVVKNHRSHPFQTPPLQLTQSILFGIPDRREGAIHQLKLVDLPSSGIFLITLAITGVLLIVIFALIELRVFSAITKSIRRKRQNYMRYARNIYDEDVYYEADRVYTLVEDRKVTDECLVVQNLSKSYKSFAAVSSLSFAVHHGECFGLLGVNGAGRTTTFRMITGATTPTGGKIIGFGTTIDKSSMKFLSCIGYCPQSDAILPQFTGLQMLYLFAGLRGVPYSLFRTCG